MNHSRQVTPIPIIFKGFDIFGRKIQNDNFDNVDKSADADDADTDDKNEENEDNVPTTHMTRCNYGLCDFQQILFKTKEDFKTHLENQHGKDENEWARQRMAKNKIKTL